MAGVAPLHNVMWTGGWDSTFRVADLVLTHGRAVQPRYLIDPTRLSTQVELDTIAELREAIAAKRNDAESLLLPLAIHHVSDLPSDAETDARLRRLRTTRHLGPQYDLLMPLGQSLAARRPELCLHRDDSAHIFLRLMDDDLVRDPAAPPDDVYMLADEPSNPDLAVFSYFRFPLLGISKMEMGEQANLRGFGDLMEMTWFCRNPTRRRQPCGICEACSYTRKEGLGRRVPDVNGPLRLARRVDRKARRGYRKAGRLSRKLYSALTRGGGGWTRPS